MPDQFKRHADRVTIQLNNEASLANVVSIQPIFHEDGVINESHLFFLYRKVVNGHFRYCCESRLRLGAENQIILDKMIPFTRLNNRLYWEMYKNARHFYLLGRQWLWWKKANRLLYELNSLSWMMRCTNLAFGGDTLISSNKKAFPYMDAVHKRWKYKFVFTDPPMPKNMLIQTCSGYSNFDRPLVACPILNKKKFLEFCDAKNCHIENIPVVTKNQVYPITQRFHYIYKLYEDFINEYPPKWWYIENLGGELAQNYYTFLRFYISKTKRGRERRQFYTIRYTAENIVYKRRLKRLAKEEEQRKKERQNKKKKES